VQVNEHSVKVAVAHGLSNVESVLAEVRQAKAEGRETPFHFIEVMACPGGCVGGGGQPYGITDETRQLRGDGLYLDDAEKPIRYSHENPSVKALYAEFLKDAGGRQSHTLLHTTYKPRPEYKR
jgi:NADH-quinone oxidoreductase subunit G